MTIEQGPDSGSPIDLLELRMKLDQMTERISSRLKDRTRFPLNKTVYIPGGVQIKDNPEISYFEYSLKGLETYHRSLGRYEDEDQHPVLGLSMPMSSVEGRIRRTNLSHVTFDIGKDLVTFYPQLMEKYCKDGDDPQSYGETVYIDADLVELMHERINIGRFVAESKVRKDPSIFNLETDEEIINALINVEREEAVINKGRAEAEKYGFNPDMAGEAFRWVIDRTMDVEVAYVRQAKPNQE